MVGFCRRWNLQRGLAVTKERKGARVVVGVDRSLESRELGNLWSVMVLVFGQRQQRKRLLVEPQQSRTRRRYRRRQWVKRSLIDIPTKLLKKMGYKGGGLGKSEQGIVVPIEAKLRPKKNMGVGFNEYKEISLPALHDESEETPLSNCPDQPVEGRKRKKLWSKQFERIKKVHITAEELLSKKQDQGFEVVQMVFDMRGSQVRILTNLENLNSVEKEKDSYVPMPELQHNIRLIIDLVELDIQKIDNDLRNEREVVVLFQMEKEKLKALAAFQKEQLNLKQQYPEEYNLCNLSCIACSYVLPLFVLFFQGWNPLQTPTHGLEEVSLWKNLLQVDDILAISNAASLYSHLFMEVVFPAVRISCTNTWQAREPERMLRFLESWEKLFPPTVLQTILENIVLPKLSAAVDSWDPHRETIPVHSWLHPWLPFLGQKLESFYFTIRSRLETIQHVDQFYWVRTWATAAPIHHMIRVMDIFFSKWQEFLYHWLHSSPNFEVVTEWYLGWKELLPHELLENEHVQYRLSLVLCMMNQAVEGLEVVQPGVSENISYLGVLEQRQIENQEKAAAQAQGRPSVRMDGTGGALERLKDIIETHAQQNHVLFKPKPGRMQDGHQIYGFGNISIIVDSLNQKVFAHIEDRWSLVSVDQLVDLQNQSDLKSR
ncbi:hypothetical protein K7X08_024705 [Anisodus acutangulus]|uniref:G-patch domain-containing protein n=1 Tax=Anisodus acutangulus TaxID=402998 RepID=A0A9Q1MC35_9SOLA|nr:hypothetical protein K7X08_024705 [Anisodus acutangulus]